MIHRTLAVYVVVIAVGVLILALGMVRASTPQSSVPRATPSAIPYFIADGTGKTGFRPSDRQLALWAFEAWQRSAAKGLRFEAAPESSALVRLYWAEPADGQYGEMQSLLVDGRRGAAVFIRPDMEALGPDIAQRAGRDPLLRDSIVYLTCVHELGHALGLPHTRHFQDIMYFFGYGADIAEYFGRYRAQLRSRSGIATVSGLSKADVARIRAIYVPEKGLSNSSNHEDHEGTPGLDPTLHGFMRFMVQALGSVRYRHIAGFAFTMYAL